MNYFRVGPREEEIGDEELKPEEHRREIEPWLSAVFQSEHLSLLTGNGLSMGVAHAAGAKAASMAMPTFGGDLGERIAEAAKASAEAIGRKEANFEDVIRTSFELLRGLKILGDEKATGLADELRDVLSEFHESILAAERGIREAIESNSKAGREACGMLVTFLLSFSSRAASRDRLNLFTTNYDRLIEYGADHAGLRIIDRFVGTITPEFRAGRLNVDLHYNPPGIRGEPRYMEGVVRLTKLHGSVDWRQDRNSIKRYGIPFGAQKGHSDLPESVAESVMIYPNSAKDIETSDYPYSEMFRDFAAAVCRPNSALVTYGYGFGDDHINRVIRDMLTISSTHLVIISFDDPIGLIQRFCDVIGHDAQISMLMGNHFGNLADLARYYLPKPAIDLITWRRADLLRRRAVTPEKPESTNDAKPAEGSEDVNAN